MTFIEKHNEVVKKLAYALAVFFATVYLAPMPSDLMIPVGSFGVSVALIVSILIGRHLEKMPEDQRKKTHQIIFLQHFFGFIAIWSLIFMACMLIDWTGFLATCFIASPIGIMWYSGNIVIINDTEKFRKQEEELERLNEQYIKSSESRNRWLKMTWDDELNCYSSKEAEDSFDIFKTTAKEGNVA